MTTELVPTAGLAGEVAQYGPTRRVQVLVAAWLASYDSEHTQKAYGRDMKMWLQFCDGAQLDPLDAIRAHVDAWKLRGAGYASPKPVSVARRLSAVSSWYGYLVHEEVIDRSPAAHVRRPKLDQDYSPTRGLTKDEARDMLITAAELGPRELALVSLLLLSGLRCAEVVMAEVEHLGHDRGHRTLDVTRKGGAQQRIPLAPATVVAVEAYLEERATGPLLVTASGARISPPQVFRTIRKVALAAKVPHAERVSPHSLRHAFATLSLDAGAALRDVQAAMGHKDPKTTMRYDRARGQLDRNPTYALTQMLSDDQ